MLKKKILNIIISFLAIIHCCILATTLLVPLFCNDNQVLIRVYYLIISIFIGWIIFDGKCWLSEIERYFYRKLNKKQVSDDNIMVEYLFSWFNLRLSAETADIILWSLTYTAIVILSHKLNILNEGFSLMIGWIIYKKAIVENNFYSRILN